jgi:hypothetical protein
MSKRINVILVFSVFIICLLGCSTANIPVSYRFNPSDLKKEITGNWIEINMHSKSNVSPDMGLSGELIAIQSDTVYILTEEQLNSIQINKINEAILYIFSNQGGKYAVATGLLYLPDIIAAIVTRIPSFLVFGVPLVIVGSSISIYEASENSNRLIYPKENILEDFKKYARFPQGMPQGITKEKLHLIITN